MDHTKSLQTGLGRLFDTLDKTPINVDAELSRLGGDLAHAVDSYLGLSITITGLSGPVTLTTWQGTGEATADSSLLIPLPLICPSAPGSALILYAATPGAFVDLGADLSFALEEPLTAFEFDAHLAQHPDESADPQFTGLNDFSNINRAIGVLLARGHTHEQALTELWDRAGAAGHASRDLHAAAEAIIITAQRGVDPHPY